MNRRNLLLGLALPFIPTVAAKSNESDLALILADDVSDSMNDYRFNIQKQGTIKALQHPRFLKAATSGYHRNIMICYFQWSGVGNQKSTEWFKISNQNDVNTFTLAISNMNRSFSGMTSIGSAMVFAKQKFLELPNQPHKLVLDISGDGTDNTSNSIVLEANRQTLLDINVTINGLVFVEGDDEEELLNYYTNKVIGGPASFAIPVDSPDRYADTLLRKLLMEVS